MSPLKWQGADAVNLSDGDADCALIAHVCEMLHCVTISRTPPRAAMAVVITIIIDADSKDLLISQLSPGNQASQD